MKNRQGLTIAALIIAIVGLSIGFAAFSNTLTISSSATVNPSDENFIVQFSKYLDSDATGELNPITPTALTSDYGENGLIPTSDKKKLQDLHATFTEPGQSVTYELYVRNTGAYVAYLKDLSFANAEHATNGETYKHCYAKTENVPATEQATGTLVSTACQGISISVSIGTATNITPDSASKSLGNQALQANGGNVKATITISYTGDNYVDGPMEVEFGDISFNASSNPALQQQEQGGQGGNEQQQGGQETPASNTVTLTTAEIGGSEFSDNIFLYNVTSVWSSEQKQKLGNNITPNSNIEMYNYFNDISCSDNTLTNKSNEMYGQELEREDNYYFIDYIEYEGQSMLQIQIKKNGVIMTDENYTDPAFSDITFTITGTDS